MYKDTLQMWTESLPKKTKQNTVNLYYSSKTMFVFP